MRSIVTSPQNLQNLQNRKDDAHRDEYHFEVIMRCSSFSLQDS
jgi:hypothetical protein